ncbi:2-hydroxycarboxylate transporter family protein [Paenibacillus polymyxa]|uniref:2-hydroxycarboxylate transporter family protein n=1 Tax=Paenibacillus polymyxa TaxID=1406 RepID=UPI001F10581B|nr:2-hydroxycarboxylate transporter family protein [Paenibacillus polymyxa]UMR35231.1 2-hydroxycarboxylate transporter family protein [Paenibacillus polymyxa]
MDKQIGVTAIPPKSNFIAQLKKIKISGLSLKYYIPFSIIILLAVYTGNLNKDIIGSIAFLLMAGGLFSYVGGVIPIFGSWMGGAILLPLFGGSALVYFGLIPDYVQTNISGLIGSGFVNLFLSAIIIGSILSMDRKVLVSISLRLLPCIIGALAFVFIFLVLGSLLTGSTLLEGLFMIGLPNYSGGSSGAIAIVPSIYSPIFHKPAGTFSGQFLVYMNISNLICVIFAGLLHKLGKRYPSLTGNGELLKNVRKSADQPAQEKAKVSSDLKKDITKLGTGLFVSVVFIIAGNILQSLIPQLNFIAWAVILVIIVKATGFLDDTLCQSSDYWQGFMVRNFLPFLITGIGIASLDLSQVSSYFTVSNFIIIIFGVIGSVVGSLIVGKFMKFHPIDSMIAVGLNLGNLGGTGAIGVLSTSERMGMMPFATIANRIGGAIMVIVISLLLPYFL